jgi:hypothetical protein
MQQDQTRRERQLLQMVLHSKLAAGGAAQCDGSPAGGMRTQSPGLQADDVQGSQGYGDVDGVGPQMFGAAGHNSGARGGFRQAAEDAFAAQLEDRWGGRDVWS